MSRKPIYIVLAIALFSGLLYVGIPTAAFFRTFNVCSPPHFLSCKGANLTGRDLSGLNAENANFYEANLTGANLSGADLSGAELSSAILKEANLSGTNSSDAIWIFTDLSYANLSNADFSRAVLGGDLNHANLTNTNFFHAILTNVDMTGVDLTGANLTGADLTGAQMYGAILNKTTMPDGTLRTGTIRTFSEFNSGNAVQAPAQTRQAVSLSCKDGMVLAYCQVYWSDGSYKPLPMGIGQRQGGVVDAIIYYDLQWNPTCILLYADGSIMTSYDTGKCS